jgi:hypothetical protein
MESSCCEGELHSREVLRKEWESVVSAALSDVEAAILADTPGFHRTMFFGAMGINPGHLAIWCFFKMDEDLKDARVSGLTGKIDEAVRDSLIDHGFPVSIASSFSVSFATDEDVQRTCDGSYWNYLK